LKDGGKASRIYGKYFVIRRSLEKKIKKLGHIFLKRGSDYSVIVEWLDFRYKFQMIEGPLTIFV